MKVAVCLHGYFENKGGIFDSFKGYEYLKKKVLDKTDCDIFIHSWDIKNRSHIEKLYDCKKITFEQQKMFEDELKIIDQNHFFGESNTAPGMYSINNCFKGLSFSYSRQQSIKLKKLYEEENNFKYDCVIVARFDIGQRGKEHPQKYYATNINFDPDLNMNFLYSAFWDQLNHGFADHWFYSNSENMDVVGNLYDKLTQYYQSNSEYVNSVINGWPDSNENEQFSNEMLSDNKTDNLKKWPLWACVDNHKLYKWYFIDTGLYKKCRFVDITVDE